MRCASSAGIISPVKHSSCATPLPHNRASRCDPPYPGKIPSFTSGCPSFAVLLAIRMVQESASSQPPPSANPLIAQIDGFPIVSSRWKTPWPKSENSLPLTDRKSTRLNSSHGYISYAVFCLKKKNHRQATEGPPRRYPLPEFTEGRIAGRRARPHHLIDPATPQDVPNVLALPPTAPPARPAR